MGRAAIYSNFDKIVGPWKDFGKLLKGELKRTVINLNTFLQISLGPTLARADYAEVMRKNKEKISKIDKDAEEILDRLPAGGVATTVGWAIAPGPMLFNSVREVSKKVTPETVENFMKEYGFNDLAIGRIPVGKLFTGIAKKGAQVGGFATLNRQAYEISMSDLEDKAEPKWYTPLERIFLLQNPFKRGPGARSDESFGRNGDLLVEAEQQSEEEKAFLDYLKLEGFETKYMQEVGIPYVEAKDELITGIVDLFEKEIQETALISTAATFDEFVKAVQQTTMEKFKPLKSQNIADQMSKEVDGLVEDKETLEKFLKAAKKGLADFENKPEELKEFVTQKLYEKEFTEVRMQSVTSIEEAVEEIKIEILGDLEEKNLKDIRINPLGEQLYNSIVSGLQRLDAASAAIYQAQSQAEKVAS